MSGGKTNLSGDPGSAARVTKSSAANKSNSSRRERFLKWCDDWWVAADGLKLAMKDWRFWLVAIIVLLIFGTFMNLLASGVTALNLLVTADWGMRGQIFLDACLGLFGIGREFIDWLLVFVISLLQGVLIALLFLVWRGNRKLSKRNKRPKKQRAKKLAEQQSQTENTKSSAESTGLVAGLAILGAGCPTCGTTLLTPLIGVIFSGGSYAIAGTISGALVTIAIIVALLTVQKLAVQFYAIMVASKRLSNRDKSSLNLE